MAKKKEIIEIPPRPLYMILEDLKRREEDEKAAGN